MPEHSSMPALPLEDGETLHLPEGKGRRPGQRGHVCK